MKDQLQTMATGFAIGYCLCLLLNILYPLAYAWGVRWVMGDKEKEDALLSGKVLDLRMKRTVKRGEFTGGIVGVVVEPIDVGAITERHNEAESIFLTAAANGAMPAMALAAMYPSLWEDFRALLAEVERLQKLVGGMNPCPKCGTIHLVRKAFVINAQRDRYPSGFGQLPNRILLYGGSRAVAEKILDALDDYLTAGTGCDDFYVLEE